MRRRQEKPTISLRDFCIAIYDRRVEIEPTEIHGVQNAMTAAIGARISTFHTVIQARLIQQLATVVTAIEVGEPFLIAATYSDGSRVLVDAKSRESASAFVARNVHPHFEDCAPEAAMAAAQAVRSHTLPIDPTLAAMALSVDNSLRRSAVEVEDVYAGLAETFAPRVPRTEPILADAWMRHLASPAHEDIELGRNIVRVNRFSPQQNRHAWRTYVASALAYAGAFLSAAPAVASGLAGMSVAVASWRPFTAMVRDFWKRPSYLPGELGVLNDRLERARLER